MTPLAIERVEACDVLVIGGGAAGLAAALACTGRSVHLLTGGPVGLQGASAMAQGGVAAALDLSDSVTAHARDTRAAGAGLVDSAVAALVASAAPEEIARLLARGVPFDREADGALALGREAAHTCARIVHAHGDATGLEITRALGRAAAADERIRLDEAGRAVELLRRGGRVVGALVEYADQQVAMTARAVILCTGGSGWIFAQTTQPPSSRGEGLALAARAGARLADLEFVQFHPTALDVDEDPRPLLSEALRGAGATLVDSRGHRFMFDVDRRGELAGRDIVARALAARLAAGERVYLDGRRAIGAGFPRRFPTVFEACRRNGFDPRREPIPVRPAAHYHMGGVVTDTRGRTSLTGLWAAGEVACTGLHGANRLASNSLLECLVFGRRAAEDVLAQATEVTPLFEVAAAPAAVAGPRASRVEWRVRSLMSEHLGVLRDGPGLDRACAGLDELEAAAGAAGGATHSLWAVARLVATAARARAESIGSHWRTDAPSTPTEPFRLVWDGARATDWDDFEVEAAPPAGSSVDDSEVAR